MDNKFGLYIVLTVIIIVVIGMLDNKNKSDELGKEFEITKGRVIDFSYANFSYSLGYSFEVKGVQYIGRINNMTKFNCDDGTLGCIGKEFTVKYSTLNPKNNQIDLRRYNRYKPYTPGYND